MFQLISRNGNKRGIVAHYWRQHIARNSAVTSSSSSSSSNSETKAYLSSSSSSSTTASSYGLYRLLSQNERKLLEEQRQLTETSRQLASQVEATRTTPSSSSSSLDAQYSSRYFLEDLQLEATFSVVIAGEFNAGKSTLINALLGSKLLETGALPTTDSITIVTAASSSSSSANNKGGVVEENENKDEYSSPTTALTATATATANTTEPPVTNTTAPSPSPLLGVVVHSVEDLPLLEDLTLVDTPGTNSAWMDHTQRTKKMLPAADLILFVTSADRPFSDSERDLLQSIQAYRKNIVVVINKMDILDSSGGKYGQEQKDEVVDFVTDKASELLGARPVVIPVSSRDGLSAKLMEKKSTKTNSTTTTTKTKTNTQASDDDRSAVWHRSNFAALETFLKETLTTQAKLKSKLSNPIGVSEGVMAQCLQVLNDQREELQVDVATLNIFQSQFEGWKKELVADLTLSQNTMTDMVRQEGQRCDILLNRMNNPYTFYYWTIFDTNQLEEEWLVTKREVAVHRQHDEDLKADLMEHVLETADSVATRGRAQGQAVIEYLGKRPAVKNNQSLVGSVTTVSRFEETRKNLIERLSKAVDDILKAGAGAPADNKTTTSEEQREHDLDKDRLFSSLKQTAILSSSLQAGALGSGLLLALQMIDIDPITGWIGVSSLFLGGGGSYTIGKARIRQRYTEQWSRRAQHLNQALDAITTKEVDRVNRRILDGVAPYTRFVETEQERIGDLQERCERVVSASRNLRNRINKLR